jgi:dolichol-phosphate mannosyltransferase
MIWGVRLVALMQLALGLRVLARLMAASGGIRIGQSRAAPPDSETVTILIPVLNEAARLSPCLESVSAQGHEVAEILVIDGGSTDGTQDLIRRWESRDNRLRMVDASPVPNGVNGKAHGLQKGWEASDPSTRWMLTIDADVRAGPRLARSLLAHAAGERVPALSAATRQRLSGPAEGLLHPAMLTTLVYRFGIPGSAATRVERVQANGQCFLVRRDILERTGGFASVADSVCEDVTLARQIAALGYPVGFYETDDLARGLGELAALPAHARPLYPLVEPGGARRGAAGSGAALVAGAGVSPVTGQPSPGDGSESCTALHACRRAGRHRAGV